MIETVFLLAQQAAEAGAEGRRNWGWLADPRTTVLFVLGSIVLIGGGRRLLMASRARKAVDRLAEPDVTPDEIVAAAEHGRASLIEFFRLLAEGQTPEIRTAAGRALAIVWANDDLIPEEEKAVLTRGFDVHWRARRRYPRAMTAPIPIEVSYGLPFLEGGPGIQPDDLEWSHRVAGAERAALELPSEWRAGSGRASFTIDPSDFPTNGPHRLILKATGRTGPRLTSNWEAEPPHVPFQVEFDPRLAPEALFTMPDASKGEAIASAIRLSAPSTPEDDGPRFLDLPGEFVVRDPPVLQIQGPLPSDLAHRLKIEFEGIADRAGAGQVVVTSEQGEGGQGLGPIEVALGPVIGLPPETFDRPGEVRLRVVLEPDPDLGWADPDIRSLWPEAITTDWYSARLIRR